MTTKTKSKHVPRHWRILGSAITTRNHILPNQQRARQIGHHRHVIAVDGGLSATQAKASVETVQIYELKRPQHSLTPRLTHSMTLITRIINVNVCFLFSYQSINQSKLIQNEKKTGGNSAMPFRKKKHKHAVLCC